MINGTSSGADVLNVTIDEDDLAPTITGIETINVTLDLIRGADATLDAADIDGATITLSSDRTGFNGVAEVDNVGDNNVVAGTNVDTLTVTGVTTGVIDTGAADTVSVTTDDNGDAANVIVNGDVALTIVTSETLVITATVAAEVTLTPGAVDDITGDSNTSLVMTAAQADGVAVSGAAALEVGANGTAADVDLSGVASGVAITIAGDTAADGFVLGDGAAVTLDEDNTAIELSAGDADESFAVTTGGDQTSLTFAVVEAASLVTTDDATIGTLVTGAANLDITIGGDLTITALTSDDEITISGTGDVDMDADDATVVDASGLVGDLTVAQDGAATNDIEVTAGSGDLDLTLAVIAAAGLADIVGQGGDDTVDATAVVANADITFVGGDGDDTLVLDVPAGAVVFVGGDGEDTVSLIAGADTSTADLTFTSVEVIDLAGATAVMLAEQLDGQTFTISGTGYANSTLSVGLDAAGESVDLSGLDSSDSAGTGALISIVGGAGDDTIVGTDTGDVIDGADGADGITLGAGADAVTQTLTESVAATAVVDFDTGAAIVAGVVIGVGDTITFGNGVDTITDFTAGSDTVNVNTTGAATSALGQASDDMGQAADDIVFLSGNFNAATGVFTVTADGAGADTLIADVEFGVEGDDIETSTSLFILVGVDSDDLVVGSFV